MKARGVWPVLATILELALPWSEPRWTLRTRRRDLSDEQEKRRLIETKKAK